MNEENRQEENNNEASSGSWWGSLPGWIQTAKEKSSTALEFMKRDLTEFGQVVQTDAVAAVSSTAAILKEKLTVDTAVDTAEAVAGKARQSISSVIETLTDVFAPHKELEEADLMMIKDSEPVLMDWWQTQLFLIRTDPKTFCHEPEGPPEMYENWLESFDPTEYQDEMTEIIMSCSETRNLYDKLVPTSVSHLEFWQRYFYRVHLLRKAEAKRADLMRRAELISIDDIEWDKEEEINNRRSNISTNKMKSDSFKLSKDSTHSSSLDKVDQKISSCRENLISSSQKIAPSDIKTLSEEKVIDDTDNSSLYLQNKNLDDARTEITDSKRIDTESSSSESIQDSRSSPIESIGKEDSSTGDDWEKDFDLDINEEDQKKSDVSNQNLLKQEEEWEQWQ